MMRTASIRLETGAEQAKALAALQAAYVDACNRLVPLVREHRVWNRVALHQRAYTMLREATPLGSQMCCKAIFSVRTRRKRGSGASGRTRRSRKSVSTAPACTSTSAPIPLRARRSRSTLHSAHAPWRTPAPYPRLRPAEGSGTGLAQREVVLQPSRRIWRCATCGIRPSDGRGYRRTQPRARSCATATLPCAVVLRPAASGAQNRSSGRSLAKRRGVTSKAIVAEAIRIGVTHILGRIMAGKRMRARLHRLAWRQLQTFVEYKAKAAGIAVEYVNPAYTSQTCSCCGWLWKRSKHRLGCPHCGLLAHSDLNASRNLARIDSWAPLSRAVVNTPDVGSVDMGNHVCASQ